MGVGETPFRIGDRATLVIDEGPWSGVSCQVDTIDSLPMYQLTLSLAVAYNEAEGMGPGLAALRSLYEHLERVGRPVWNVTNQRGPVPPTVGGMLLVPVPLVIALIDLWTDTYEVSDG